MFFCVKSMNILQAIPHMTPYITGYHKLSTKTFKHACCFIAHPRKRCSLSQTKSHAFKSCTCFILQYMGHDTLHTTGKK